MSSSHTCRASTNPCLPHELTTHQAAAARTTVSHEARLYVLMYPCAPMHVLILTPHSLVLSSRYLLCLGHGHFDHGPGTVPFFICLERCPYWRRARTDPCVCCPDGCRLDDSHHLRSHHHADFLYSANAATQDILLQRAHVLVRPRL